jgi:alpha-tubulin suppressor-like RCC1 family protein
LEGVKAIAAGFDHSVALTAPKPPGISTPPARQEVARWQHASLTVTATGYPLSYQWRKDGVNISGACATHTPFITGDQRGGELYGRGWRHPQECDERAPGGRDADSASPGAVVAWGDNSAGQTSVPVAAQSGVAAISARALHTVALLTDGSVVEWE